MFTLPPDAVHSLLRRQFYQLSSSAQFCCCLALTINASAIIPIVPLHVGGGVLLTLISLYFVTDAYYGPNRMKYTYMY